jgi:predicted Mrr-cat superfamily restriction endonuclease
MEKNEINEIIAEVDKDTKFWKMIVGEDNSHYNKIISENIIIIGDGYGVDYTGVKSESDLEQKMRAEKQPKINNYPKWYKNSVFRISLDSDYGKLKQFIFGIDIGDIVFIGGEKVLAVGVVVGSYKYDATKINKSFSHTREVKWLFDVKDKKSGVSEGLFGIKIGLAKRNSLYNITKNVDINKFKSYFI